MTMLRATRLACRVVPLAGLAAACVHLAGCGGETDAGGGAIACTAEVRTSVFVSVVDASGAPLPNVIVSYTVDGGPAQAQACAPNGVCALGLELSGLFSITAAKTGYAPASGTVAVTRDDCHVHTQSITLKLTPAA